MREFQHSKIPMRDCPKKVSGVNSKALSPMVWLETELPEHCKIPTRELKYCKIPISGESEFQIAIFQIPMSMFQSNFQTWKPVAERLHADQYWIIFKSAQSMNRNVIHDARIRIPNRDRASWVQQAKCLWQVTHVTSLAVSNEPKTHVNMTCMRLFEIRMLMCKSNLQTWNASNCTHSNIE